MVLVHEIGSGLPSLPSRRWLCADTSAVFPLIVEPYLLWVFFFDNIVADKVLYKFVV
jgi:hypothetical protein